MKKLFCYDWVGINRLGEISTGTIAMPNEILVRNELRKQGVIPRKVTRKKYFFIRNKKITQTTITVFCRQLATLLANGIPLLQAIDLTINSQTHQGMRYLLQNLKNDIETGLNFAESLQKYPYFFDKLFHSLIATGEQIGTLAIMLNRVADYNEKITA